MLPFLTFVCMAAVDYSRVIYALVTMTNCARSGAIWASNPALQASAPYANAQAAALADASTMSPQPTAGTPVPYIDTSGNSVVSMTVTYTFRTIIAFPGIPSSVNLSRTVVMPMAPSP
jgi:hypothetical protein